MADISKIKLPDSETIYNVKDIEARKRVPEVLLKDTVGWVGKNHANTNDAEIGIAWNGTSNADRARLIIPIEPSSSYVLSISGTNNFSFIGYCLTQTATPVSPTEINSFPLTLDSRSTDNYLTIAFSKTSVTKNDVETLKLMLRDASIADSTYEPYHPSVKQTLRDAEVIEGKNRLEYPYDQVSKTIEGITFINNNDGTLNISGTATAQAKHFLYTRPEFHVPKAGKYTASAEGIIQGISIIIEGYTESAWVKNLTTLSASNKSADIDIDYNGYDRVVIYIAVASGMAITNAITIKPMLRYATETDPTYEPYYKSVEEVLETKGDWDCRNLLDPSLLSTTNAILYAPIYVGDGTFTLNTTAPKNSAQGANLFFIAGNVSSGASTDNNGVWSGHSRSITSINGYVTVASRSEGGVNIKEYNNMLQSASNAEQSYTPHRDILDVAIPSKLSYADNGFLGAKNLLPYPYQSVSPYTANGITHTVNSDGSIKLNGTATADTDFRLFTGAFPKGDYILSQKNTNSLSGIIIEAYNGNTYVKGIIGSSSFGTDNKSFSIDYSGYDTVRVTIRTKNTAVLSNFTIYPMIRLASDPDSTYRPYAQTNKELTDSKMSYKDNGVLGAKNLLNLSSTTYRTSGANSKYQLTDTGIRVYTNSSESYAFTSFWLKNLPSNTDMTLSFGISISSGKGRIVISDRTDPAVIVYERDFSENGSFEIKFNTANHQLLAINFYSSTDSATGNVTYSNTLLRLASDPDDTYVPYVMTNRELMGGKFDRAEQAVLGAKNLLPYPYRTNTKTENGVTFTNNGDGSVTISTVSGGATATTTMIIVNKFNADYEYLANKHCILNGGINANLSIRMWSTSNLAISEGDDAEFVMPSSLVDNWNIYLCVLKDAVFTTPITVYPMLRIASDPDDTYVPYAMTNKELTDMLTVQESEVTNIVSGASLDGGTNKLIKFGKVVFMALNLSGVTATAWSTVIGSIPEGFRPKQAFRFPSVQGKGIRVSTNGNIDSIVNLSNEYVSMTAVWITE